MVMFIDGQYLLPGNVNCDAEFGQYIIDCCQIPLYSTCIVGLSSPNNMFIHVSVKCRSATGCIGICLALKQRQSKSCLCHRKLSQLTDCEIY